MSETLLIVADSEHDANMLYATGLFVPDPFIYLHYDRRPLLVMSDLEIDRARGQLRLHCRVAIPERNSTKTSARRRPNSQDMRTSSGIFCAREKSADVVVPDNFPLGPGARIKKAGNQNQAAPEFLPPS